jgi:hypothetical protein
MIKTFRGYDAPMIKTVSLIMLAAAVLAATALAAGVPKGLTASAKGPTVTFINHSKTKINGFFLTSTDSPKITGSSDRACKATKVTYSYGKTHTDYHLDCKDKLAAGKTRTITLKMSGKGKIDIWAKVGKFQYKFASGN